MSKAAKAVVLTVSLAIVVFAIAGGLGVKASTNNSDDSAYRQLGVYSEVLSRIRSEYVEQPNMTAVTEGALHGLLESLDANSSYLSAAQYKDYKAHKNEGRATIGATVSKRFGYATVVSVVPNGPAEKAGIDNGDILEAIEGRSTRELSLAEIQSMLNGQAGSNVTVSVVRARRADPVKTVLTRDNTQPPPPSDKILEEGIGYLQPYALTKGRNQELAARLKSLQKQGAKKLVLDLRNVSLGDEGEGVALANLFLNHGTITYLQGQKYPRQTFNADPQKAIIDMPMVVIVNRGTAGAAEIVAGSLLENARADLVGDKTFGDGSIQKTLDLPDGAAVILSVAKYYTPGGKAIQDTAITPNVMVTDKDDEVALPDEDETPSTGKDEPLKKEKKATDEPLRRAVDVLKNGITPKAAAAAASISAPAGANPAAVSKP